MRIISSITSIQKRVAKYRTQEQTIGFVPTMGAFHEGHLSLIKRCRKDSDIVVVSIFVNPIQFGPNEDLAAYPRNTQRDCRLAQKYGCDILFYPSATAMYPHPAITTINVPDVSEGLCGEKRPGHFTGVATVVAKLFHIVLPDIAYFGQKDFQQIAVIRKMVSDLNFPIRIKTVPTVREKDGLAMSSRNIYLTDQERKEAPVIYQSLKRAKQKILSGERRPEALIAFIRSCIAQTSGTIDYIECLDAQTLEPINIIRGNCVIAVAVFFGKARLIDNIVLQI